MLLKNIFSCRIIYLTQRNVNSTLETIKMSLSQQESCSADLLICDLEYTDGLLKDKELFILLV